MTWGKSGPGSFGATTSTNSFGIATITFTTAAGANNVTTITISDGSASGTSSAITTIASAGAAATFIVTSDNYTVEIGKTVNLVAHLADANNNLLSTSGVAVTWSLSTGAGGSFGTPTPSNGKTDSTGSITIPFTTASLKATYRITASGGGATGTAPAITTTNVGLTPLNSDTTGGLLAPVAFVDFSEVVNVLTGPIPPNNNQCNFCHTNGAQADIPVYDSASTIYSTLVNQVAKHDPIIPAEDTHPGVPDASPEMRVLPTDAAQSFIFFKISNCGAGGVKSGTSEAPGDQMPLGGPDYLTTEKMQIIRDWINQGAFDLPTNYTVTVSSSSPVAGAAITVTAQLRDSHGNAISLPGRTINWSLASGSGGSFSSTSTKTNTSGVATVTFTTAPLVGSYSFTATDGAALTGTSGTVTSIPGPAAQYGITFPGGASPAVGTGVTVTAQLQDANGNSVSTSGNLVTWTSTNGGSFSSGGTSSTNTSGLATITFTVSTAAGTTHTVIGKTGTITGTSGSVLTKAGAPAKYLVTSSNNTPKVGTVVTITATLADSFGNPLTSGGGPNVTWSQSGISGSFASGTSSVSSGVATVSYTCGTSVGTSTLTATDSLTAGINGNVVLTLQVGAASQYLVTSSSYAPVAGSTVTISAQLADSFGNTVKVQSNVVTWDNLLTSGNFGSPTSTTDANGLAQVTFTTSAAAGHVHTVKGTDGAGLTGTTSTNIVTVAGPGTRYSVTAATNSPAAGSTTDVITAQFVDVNGNAVATSGIHVDWTVTGLGTVSAAFSLTDSTGKATVQLNASTHTGDTCTVTGKDTSSRSGTSTTLTVMAAAASKYKVTALNSTPTVGTSVAITAQLQDAFGNSVATAGNVVSWTSANGGSFSGSTSTDGTGLATVNFTVSTIAGVVHTVTGTTVALTGTSGNITTQVGAASKYIVTSTSTTPQVATAVTITAQLADSFGNPITTNAGPSVNWTQGGVGGSFSAGNTAVTAGASSVTFTCGNLSGAATVTATDSSFTYTGTVSLTLQPAAASQYVVTASTYSPTTDSVITIFAQFADNFGNPVRVQNNTVTWDSQGTGGSFASPTSSTDANGLAQVQFTVSNVTATAHTISATDGNAITGVSSPITTVTGIATQYIVTAATNTPAAGSMTDVITAQLSDAGGNPVTTSGITVNFTIAGLGGTIPLTPVTTDSFGKATVILTASTHAGDSCTITATDTVFTADSPLLTVIAAAGDHYIVGPDTVATVGSGVPVTAQLQDVYGNNVLESGHVAAWTSTNGGSFSAPSTSTDGTGVATVTFTVSTVAGTSHQITASTGLITGSNTSISTVADVAAKYLVSTSDPAPPVATAVTLTAQLADRFGNPLTSGGGPSVDWTQSGVGGTFSASTTPVDFNGQSSVQFTFGTVAGTASLTAADSSVPALNGTVPVAAQALAAFQYLVTSSSYNPDAGTNVVISAQLADTYGNLVKIQNNVVTWDSQSTGGTFSAPTSLTDVNGVAQITFTTSVVAGRTHAIKGTDGAGLTGISPNIVTVVGPPTHYIVTASTSSPIAGSATDVITAQLADVQGNAAPVAGVHVDWTLIGPGSLSSTFDLTDGSGKVSVTFTASTLAGNVSMVQATDSPALRTGDSPSLKVVAGAAYTYRVQPTTMTPTVGAAQTVSAQLADIYGNSISSPNITITWSSTGAGGSFTPLTTTTDNSGLATVSFTAGTVAGTTHTVKATDQNTLSGVSGNIVTQTGAAAKYFLTASNTSPVVNTGVNITAQLTDAFGNPVASGGQTITWSNTSPDGSFVPPTSTVLANGQATVAFTCGATAQNVTVTATDNLGPPNLAGNMTLSLQHAAASQYVFSASTNSPVAGSTIVVFAQLTDSFGNAVPVAGNTITWNDHATGGVLLNATSLTDANGLAAVLYKTSTTANHVHTINGQDGALLTGTSVSVTTVPAPPSKYILSATPLSPISGSPVLIVAQLVDSNGNFVSSGGKTVTWSRTTVGGSFSSNTATVDATGQAAVTFTTSTVTGTVTIRATDNTLPTPLTGTVTFTSVTGPAQKYVVTSSVSNPVAGTTVTISAQLADINNNPIAASGIQVNWSNSGSNGLLASPAAFTDVNGLATVQFTVSTTTPTIHTVSAIDGGGISGTSGAITVMPGAPVSYRLTASGVNPVAGSAIAISAQLQDINGNSVPTAGITVSWSATATGTFGTSTSSTNASGLASVAFTTAAQAGVTFTISGTDGNGLSGTTAQITTVRGAPTAYIVTSSNNRPQVGAPVTMTAQMVDSQGNPVATSGVLVNWTHSGSGTFAAPGSVTGANGAATIVFTTGPLVGIFTVTATDGSGFTGNSFPIGTVSGPGVNYIVTASSTSIVAGNAVRITAQLVDANGNFANTAGRVITWSSSAGGSFSPPTSTTDGTGQAGAQFTTGLVPNTSYSVTATDGSGVTGVGPVITASASAGGSGTGATVGAPVITSPMSASGGVNTPFSFTITATGNPTISFSASPLPAGLILSGDTITGSPTTAGTFVVHLGATNAAGSDHEDIVLLISPQQDLSVDRAQVRLNFVPTAKTGDNLTAAFSVTLPDVLDRSSATMDVYFGSIKLTGLTMLKSKTATGATRLSVRTAAPGSSTLKLTVQVTKADLKALSQNGLLNSNISAQPLSVPVAVVITTPSKTYDCGTNINMIYTGKANQIGIAKKAP